jgi:lysophospholipase L1-like esterase
MRMTRAWGVGVVVALVCAVASPARAAEGEYVALGDSFTSGPLIPDQHGTPAGCLRSTNNYPSVAAARLGHRLVDVSCSGARTVDMTAPQRTRAGVNPPQLDALTTTTRLVTVGIGGNDIGFTDIAVACAAASFSDPFGAPCAKKYGDTLNERVRDTEPKVAAVLRGIRGRSPRAKVLAVGYLRLLPESPGCWPLVPFAWGDVTFLDDLERRLNTMIERVARANDVGFVDAYQGGLGHDTCASPTRRWVEGFVPASPAAPVHPNAAGMREVADRVVHAVEG